MVIPKNHDNENQRTLQLDPPQINPHQIHTIIQQKDPPRNSPLLQRRRIYPHTKLQQRQYLEDTLLVYRPSQMAIYLTNLR